MAGALLAPRLAAAAGDLGAGLGLLGALPSVRKLLDNGEYMTRNAFEVSCFTLEADAPAAPAPLNPRMEASAPQPEVNG